MTNSISIAIAAAFIGATGVGGFYSGLQDAHANAVASCKPPEQATGKSFTYKPRPTEGHMGFIPGR